MITINRKVITSWTLVILWAVLIFVMSSMNGKESNDTSKKAIDVAFSSTLEVTNKTEITNNEPSENKINKLIDKLNAPLRKVAHASEFCVLSILIVIALNNSGVSGKKIYFISIILCFIYACTDEFHQSFVEGRTGQIIDTLVDTAGGMIGCVIMKIKHKIFVKDEN